MARRQQHGVYKGPPFIQPSTHTKQVKRGDRLTSERVNDLIKHSNAQIVKPLNTNVRYPPVGGITGVGGRIAHMRIHWVITEFPANFLPPEIAPELESIVPFIEGGYGILDFMVAYILDPAGNLPPFFPNQTFREFVIAIPCLNQSVIDFLGYNGEQMFDGENTEQPVWYGFKTGSVQYFVDGDPDGTAGFFDVYRLLRGDGEEWTDPPGVYEVCGENTGSG